MTTDARGRIAAARPRFPDEDFAELSLGIEGVLRSGRLILGPHTAELERSFAEYTGIEHAIAVSSCTAALQIAFRYLGVRGKEVVLSTNNFPGVVSAIIYEGGIPVFAEMDPDTFCIDTKDALRRVTAKTAGVVATHIAGLVCPEMDTLRDACRAAEIFLMEDASHAHGASIDGRKAGSLADVGCFSFYPTKIMTTGTGGMLTTRNPELADYARSLRHHGQGTHRNEFVAMGNDWCMSEIHALLGLQQLRRLDESVEHRNRVVARYRERLAEADWLILPTPSVRARHAYYKFPLLLREGLDGPRFRRILEEDFGIENGSVYDPPCHLQPVFRDLPGCARGAFPRAEATLERQVCPPVHSSLTEDEVAQVVQAMLAVRARL